MAFALAAAGSYWAAGEIVTVVESRTAGAVGAVIADPEYAFAEVAFDGLRVELSGTAPDEATRFRVLSAVGTVVAPDRILDRMEVMEADPITPLRFSLEILRNDDGISLIGLVPDRSGRETILTGLGDLAPPDRITDMLDTVDRQAPESWDLALDFALSALNGLPRSKISVTADRVAISAITNSWAEKDQIETGLNRSVPTGITLELDISAPRPVITPFTLRFSKSADGASFDACSADTAEAKDKILQAARDAGAATTAGCTIGLGVPSATWSDAVVLAIKAVNDLGGGSVAFADADVTLFGLDTTDPAVFERIVSELGTDLPDLFSLQAVLPEAAFTNQGASDTDLQEFISTLSPEGLVQLRGRLPDASRQEAAKSMASAMFGTSNVYSATRVDPTLPEGWTVRVLAGLEALGELNNGTLVVQADYLALTGATGDTEKPAEISRLLASKLGDSEDIRLSIRYEPALDPQTALPTPEECVADISGILDAQKITFDPGSASIAEEAQDTIDAIAEVLVDCSEVEIEVAGHTDSQGREQMNLNLSQSRAEAVLAALQGRRILTGNLSAKGYGEANPIADNGTDAGREANRRIEFTLVAPETETTESDETVEDADTNSEAPASGESDEQN